jgi:hypothetical protein
MLFSSTRPVSAQLSAVLEKLKPGQRIRVTQTIRVGLKQWTTTVTGLYRELKYLATGVTTDRVPEDEIVVPTVHFTKDNGELSSIAIDELTRVEPIEG